MGPGRIDGLRKKDQTNWITHSFTFEMVTWFFISLFLISGKIYKCNPGALFIMEG